MDHALLTQDHDAIARLLSKNVPTANERLWCVLSSEWRFDGSRLTFDGTAAQREELFAVAARSAESGGVFAVWTPREKRQRGRIPRSLRCGFTVFPDGDRLIVFQSVVFVPRPGKIDLIATTRTGQYVSVPEYIVASWDGSPIDEPLNVIPS